MLIGSARPRRSGAVMAEAAIVLPVLFLIILGMSLLGLGVFRHQQVATVAREGARWASVHGGQYSAETGHAIATPTTVYNSAIKPFATALDQSALSYTVTWLDPSEMPTFKDTAGNTVVNTVTVSITYNWVPEAIFGPMTLKSTSVMPVSY